MAQYIAPFDSPVFLLQSELTGKFMYYFYEIRNLNFYILHLCLLNELLLISYFLRHKLSSETHFFVSARWKLWLSLVSSPALYISSKITITLSPLKSTVDKVSNHKARGTTHTHTHTEIWTGVFFVINLTWGAHDVVAFILQMKLAARYGDSPTRSGIYI